MPPDIVVVPCYNESRRLPISEFREFASNHPDWQFLFVDDGSQDTTWDVLCSLVAMAPDTFFAMRLSRNQGKAEAVRQGIIEAGRRGPRFIAYWDADLATPLETLLTFRQLLDTHPSVNMVMGARVRLLGRRIERSWWRHYLGRCFATAVSLALRIPVYDTQCGAKMIRSRPNVLEAFAHPFASSWVFDVELLSRLIRMSRDTPGSSSSSQIVEIPLDSWVDVAGSKLRLQHFVNAFWGFVRIVGRHYSSSPAKENVHPPLESSTASEHANPRLHQFIESEKCSNRR